MKNLSRAEKAAICLALLFIAFTAGFFLGRSTASTVITFAEPNGVSGPAQLSAPESAPPALPQSGNPETKAPAKGTDESEPKEAAAGSSESEKAPIGGLININTATLSELDALPGIGPALAQRIIDYREKNGPFLTPADIMSVSGIGEKKFDAIREMITTGG